MFAKTPIEPNAIYTREETAHLLSVSLSTLKQLIRTGQLKVSQPAGLRRVFIRGTSILEMLEQSERGSLIPANSFYKSSRINQEPKSKRSKPLSARARTHASPKNARVSGGANR